MRTSSSLLVRYLREKIDADAMKCFDGLRLE